MALPLKEESH
jgi:superfamily II DNA helicase RecQ